MINAKRLLYAGLGVLTLLFFCLFLYRFLLIPDIQPIAGTKDTTMLLWENNAGRMTVSVKGQQEAFAKKEKHLLDSIAGIYKTTSKRIRELVVAASETHTQLKPVPGTVQIDYKPSKDSCPPVVKNLRQHFQSPYYSADVQVGDSSFLNLSGRDTVTVLWKRVREGNIFHRKHFIQIDASTANPDTKVAGLLAYRIAEPKPKKWAIGLQFGYGFSPVKQPLKSQPLPYVGLGISRTLIRF